MKLSVSYLSISNQMEQAIKDLSRTSIDYLHVDIMDGSFVPNKTSDDKIQLSYLKHSQKPLDIHLMVEDVEHYIDIYKELKPTYITFHIELNDRLNMGKIIEKLHQEGIGVGLSLKPSTSVDEILPYLNIIDMVLVMSVEPGMGGQTFLPIALEKIKILKQYQKDYTFSIEVDGGINKETSYQCKVAGADIVVVGSYITKESDYQKQINQLEL